MNQITVVLLAMLAGVCAGYSKIVLLKKPHPGWLIASALAVWLALVYAGTVTV